MTDEHSREHEAFRIKRNGGLKCNGSAWTIWLILLQILKDLELIEPFLPRKSS